MYNRYILQNDGTHRRNSMPDPVRPQPQPRPSHSEPPCSVPIQPKCDPPQKRKSCPARQDSSALSFLKKLLPGDFDTGDLMIVLLLILMAGDCQEDQNWAWLTLALYLFL